MSADLGPGDVVEHTETHRRRIVLRIIKLVGCCVDCGKESSWGFYTTNASSKLKCPYHWRKIGGSEADTVRQFEQHLIPSELEPA